MSWFARANIALNAHTRPDFDFTGVMLPWASGCALLLGVFAFTSLQHWLLPWFFAAGYVVLLSVFVKTAQFWRDPLNPLCLVVTIGFLRFFCPGLLFMAGAEPPANVDVFFLLMNLSDGDWQLAHALALTGILSAICGWLLVQRRWRPERRGGAGQTDGVKYAALAGMLVGVAALAAFFLMNASIGALFSGTFRSVIVQEGTGKYFILSYLAVAGSVLLCDYFLRTGANRLAWIPIALCMLSYWPLGGRGRAMFPVACGLILMWYRRRERQGWARVTVRPRTVCKAAAALIGLVLLSYVGAIYRGDSTGYELNDLLSLSGLWGYIAGAVYTDFGALHSLAGAIAIGPAVLGGQNLLAVFLWPLSKFVAISERSAGIYIVEELVGFEDDRKWAVSPTIIGDAYLSLGLWGVVIVLMVYGALLKTLYVEFRQGRIPSPIYALFLLNSLLMVVSSINVWSQIVTLMSFTLGLIFLGKTVFNRRAATPYRRAVSAGGGS